jgi:hypothetical protein
MGRRALIIVLLLFLAGFAYIGYNTYDAKRAGASGDVFSHDPSPDAPASNSTTSQPPTQTVVLPSPPTTQTPSAAPSNGDTISPNPPNGMIFSGTGRFQLYRQGNLTWRINTETGKSCILFATDEEWEKTKVYRAGCGSH